MRILRGPSDEETNEAFDKLSLKPVQIMEQLIATGSPITYVNIAASRGEIIWDQVLAIALYHSSIEYVRLALDSGANVELDCFSRSYHMRESALSYACYYRDKLGHENLDIVQLLVERGANVLRKNRDGYYPLYNALISNNIKTFKYLLDHGALITGSEFSVKKIGKRLGKFIIDYCIDHHITSKVMKENEKKYRVY